MTFQNPDRARHLRELYKAMAGKEWKPLLLLVVNNGKTPMKMGEL